MKRFLRVVLVSVFTLIVSTSCVKADEIQSDNFTTIEETFSMIDYNDPVFAGRQITQSSNFNFLYNDGASEEKMLIIENAFYNVPPKIFQEFEMNGWKIVVTNRSINDLFFHQKYSVIAGLLYERKEIWVSNRTKSACDLLHEFGHYIDFHHGDPGISEEFVAIYQSEVNSFANYHQTHSYNYRTETEYFAESYAEFVLNPEQLALNCPQTYNFFTGFTNSL